MCLEGFSEIVTFSVLPVLMMGGHSFEISLHKNENEFFVKMIYSDCWLPMHSLPRREIKKIENRVVSVRSNSECK